MKRISIIALGYAITFWAISCKSFSKEDTTDVQSQQNTDTLKLAAASADTLSTSIRIPADQFFSGEGLAIIKAGEQHESSLYVPLQLVLRDGLLLIPNIAMHEIWGYDWTGRKTKVITIPKEIQGVDYFDFLNNGNLIIANFSDGKLFELDDQGSIQKEFPVDDIKFSCDGQNYLYRTSTVFADKLQLFGAQFSQSFDDSSFDYLLSGNEFFVTYYSSDTLVIRKNKTDGTSQQFRIADLSIEDSSKPQILTASKTNIKILLDPVIFRKDDLRIFSYDFNTESGTISVVKNPATKDILIGEGAMIWGAGMIYRYQDGLLHVMQTTPQGISIVKLQL